MIHKTMYGGRRVSLQDINMVSLEMEDNNPKNNLYKECYYAGDSAKYISWLNADKKPLHDVLGFKKEINGITIDIALQWYIDGYSDTMLGYANGIRTNDGGTHIDGVKASITRTLNNLAKMFKVVKNENITFSGEHLREGLTCIVSVIVPNPEFEGQTQTRLGNPYIREVVDQSVQAYLTEYFELHPDVLESIISKSLNAYKTALAVKRARQVTRSNSVSIPEKLTNCSSEKPEIFTGRGDSSGGAAKHGPDRRFQEKDRFLQKFQAMSSVTARRVSREDIQLVQNLIERCLQLYMNQKEVVDTLLEQAKIEPGFTELVWQKLEEENREFFKAYYLRLMVKQQIMEYNKLLEQQIHHMHQTLPIGVASGQNRNGSHVPSVNQQQLCFAPKGSNQSSPNLSSAYLNGGSALNTNIPSSVNFSTHSRRVDPPALSLQATSMPLMQGMIKSETPYSNCAPYMYGGEAHSTVGDASIASLSNDSGSQSLKDPLVDADAATFGFLGQIPRNFSLSDLTADFSQSSEILESYEKSPFLLADADNFLDSNERVEPQGDQEILGAISEGFSYENLGSK